MIEELKKELQSQIEQQNKFLALYNQAFGARQLLEYLINKLEKEGDKTPSDSEKKSEIPTQE